ncbi:butyrophilin-like protein 10 isoform 1-T1 [Odontesthes bonariensis]|uniref:butyrophilin-like protein 10 isoform X1 n=2 Tax=Odontesthes bonariensis TaxID=219752 RepID=UPI003F583290
MFGRWSWVFWVGFVFLLNKTGTTFAHEQGPGVIQLVALEGSDVILPCSLNTKESMVEKVFDWKMDGHKEVFYYDAGIHYNNGFSGQDEQFKGRVVHFPEQLKFGNASIMIKNTKKGDGGDYNCIFPRLPSGEQRFRIQLDVVDPPPKVSVGILKTTEDGVRLKCDVAGASSEPAVEWQDSDGNILPAEEPQVSRRGGLYDVSLQISVKKTKTNLFRCVAKQEDSGHVVDEIVVPDKQFQFHPCSDVWIGLGFSGVLNVALLALVAFLLLYIRRRKKKGSYMKANGSCNGTSELPLQANGDPPC